MKLIITILALPLLAGCNALGGIPKEAITNLANAGGGCIAVESLVMGKAVMTVASSDKGVIRNGGVIVAPNCGITITDSATIRAIQPIAPVRP